MEFSVLSVNPAKVETACLVVPLFQDGELLPTVAKLDDASERLIAQLLERGDFTPNLGEVQLVPFAPGLSAERLLLVGDLADSSLVARRLAAMNYVVAAAPSYLEAHGEPRTPEALSDHNCLLYQGEMGRQRWYFQAQDQSGSTPFEVSGNLYSNDAESLLRAALLGQGLVLFPTWLIGDALACGELVPLLEAWRGEVMPGRRDIHVLTTERRLRTRKVRAFLDYLRESLGPRPAWDQWREGIGGLSSDHR